MLEASVIQLAGAFCNIKFTLISTLWYNGLVVFYRHKNGYKENIVLINQTAKKILKKDSFQKIKSSCNFDKQRLGKIQEDKSEYERDL